jgi:DsbC/DsbD-like thiol-disulfide interchange protein
MVTRRHSLGFLFALPFAGIAHAAKNPWASKLLAGGFDGKKYLAGLHLTLDPNWKTYWRVPGAGGVAPDFQFSGSNMKSATAHLPTPMRLDVNGDEIIGYKGEVIYVFEVTPEDAAKPVTLNVNAFLGVCETICIPVPIKGEISLTPIQSSTPDATLLNVGQQKLPRLTTGAGPVTKAKLDTSSAEPALVMEFSTPITDVFVEGKPTTYVRKPQFSTDGLSARMTLAGKSAITDLTGATLRVTLIERGMGLEQMVAVV